MPGNHDPAIVPDVDPSHFLGISSLPSKCLKLVWFENQVFSEIHWTNYPANHLGRGGFPKKFPRTRRSRKALLAVQNPVTGEFVYVRFATPRTAAFIVVSTQKELTKEEDSHA